MEIYGYCFNRESDIKHHGILGMKWGVRRWQNSDGTFNEAGKDRYFDKGTGENYHPVTKGAPAVSKNIVDKAKSTNSKLVQAQKKLKAANDKAVDVQKKVSDIKEKVQSFDKEKAKKIAKGVAIGAAVVGGTVLVAYGAKKMHDLNMNPEFKSRLAEIRKDTNAKFKELGSDLKLNIASTKIDPEGKLDRSLFEKGKALDLSAKDYGSTKRFVDSLTSKEVAALNSGKTTGNIHAARELSKDLFKEESHLRDVLENPGKFTEFEKRNAITNVNESRKLIAKNLGTKPDLIDEGWRTSRIVSDIANNGTGAHALEAVKENTSKVPIKSGNGVGAASKTVKALSNAASSASKSAIKVTKNTISTVNNMAKSTAKVTRLTLDHPQETKAAMDYTAQLLKNLGELSAANSRNSATVSRSSASDTYTRNQAVREYRRQHPGTKLTDSQIASNYGF